MNVTDVGHLVSDADTGEDKMEKGSRRTGKTAWEIAEKYTEAFRQDMEALNILSLNMPRALALTWEVVKSDLPDAVKKATVLAFDKVLGLNLVSCSRSKKLCHRKC